MPDVSMFPPEMQKLNRGSVWGNAMLTTLRRSRITINVAVDGNQVEISAEVKNEKEVKDGGKVLRSERYFGKLYRAFALGQDIDESATQARYVDGILELTLTKKQTAAARRITIQ